MEKLISLTDDEVKFLFKTLLNMDYKDEVRTAIFIKVEKLYIEEHGRFEMLPKAIVPTESA